MKRSTLKILCLSFSLISSIKTLQAGSERAWDHFKKHEYALAAAEFERILTQGPEDAATREGLAWSYYWLGRYDQAEKEFERAIELDPVSAGARNGIAEVKKWRYLVFNNAWQLFYSQDYVNALANFQSILEDKSGRLPAEELWKVHSGMGWCYYNLQNYTSAEKEFNSILSVYKSNPYALKGIGFTMYQMGKYDESIQYLEESLQIHPEWADVRSMIGWNLYSKGRLPDALVEFQKALDINKSLADAIYGLGWTCFKMDQHQQAMDYFDKALTISPYHPGNFALLQTIDRDQSWWKLYSRWGWSYYMTGDFASAEKMFTEASSRLQDDLDLQRGKAFSIFKQGRYLEVIQLLEPIKTQASALAPVIETGHAEDGTEYTVRSNVNSMLAWCHYYLGDYAKAQTLFEAEIKSNPDWTDLFAGLGWCAIKENKPSQAAKYLQQSLQLNPYYKVALEGMNEMRKIRYTDFNDAWNAFYSGDKKSAAAKFSAIAAEGLLNLEEKDRWQIYSGLGYSLLDQKDYPGAASAFQKVLELSPGNYYAYVGLAKTDYLQNKLDQAEKNITQALKINSETADIWALKGWILLAQKKLTEATVLFDKSLAINPADPDALTGKAYCLIEESRLQEARPLLEQVISAVPDHVKAREGLARINK